MKRLHGMGMIVALAVLGCSGGDPVEIGEEVTGEKLEDYAAVWEGYAEAHQFEDGSDRVRLVLDAGGSGTIEVGDSPPFVALDPEIWPRSPWNDTVGSSLIPGVAYEVMSARVEELRIKFDLDLSQPTRGWCELQTPILDEVNSTDDEQHFHCVPNWSHGGRDMTTCFMIDPATDEEVIVDCGKFAMCSVTGLCRCDAQSCFSQPGQARPSFDAALEDNGSTMDGTLLDGLRVRLTRVD